MDGAHLLKLREHMKMTQQQMAKYFGVNRYQYTKWENKGQRMSGSATRLLHMLLDKVTGSGRGFKAVPEVKPNVAPKPARRSKIVRNTKKPEKTAKRRV